MSYFEKAKASIIPLSITIFALVFILSASIIAIARPRYCVDEDNTLDGKLNIGKLFGFSILYGVVSVILIVGLYLYNEKCKDDIYGPKPKQ
jgi:hypothetical protein